MQADVASELPESVSARSRPCVGGIRRAVLGLAPIAGADLVHGLDVDLPIHPRHLTVSTVHDVAVFDTPWAFSGVRSRGERLLMRRAVRRADSVLAVSDFTAQRVWELFRREATVTLLAPASHFAPPGEAAADRVRQAYKLPAQFVLHVGTVEPRKNLARLADVCSTVPVPLVLAGGVAAGSVVPPGARHLGYVPMVDLAALYASATVVAYPSLYEGFGLPPLEAMACGAPVVASRVGALPAVLGEAALLVPPGDDEALRRALVDVLHDAPRRAALAEAGLAKARGMTWASTAERTLDVYRRLGISC
ncbi:MAG: hypothetical protein QOE84_480 [Actinomycetota bacterium]|nr:hypothetical protein [Actinomycetota bacterium]